MVVEIECYKGDIFLEGKTITFDIFQKQMKNIELDCGRKNDDFIALLCSRYDWKVINGTSNPIYVYDRDVQKSYKVK